MGKQHVERESSGRLGHNYRAVRGSLVCNSSAASLLNYRITQLEKQEKKIKKPACPTTNKHTNDKSAGGLYFIILFQDERRGGSV